MTDNEKLARWQGNPNFSQITLILQTDTGYWPDYLNDDAAAMSLLDTLVEKGYIWSLYGNRVGCLCKVCKMPDAVATDMQGGNNFREAVVAACLEVARKEMDV